MTELRLIADDLTGALDTTAQFVACTGPVPVVWNRPHRDAAGNLAIDAGTREADAGSAVAAAAALAPWLAPAPGRIAFWKLDSLLRGHGGAALATAMQRLAVGHAIIAPAFPLQRRITRGGRQWASDGGGWRPTGEPLATVLARYGVPVTLARPGDPVPAGASLWDAETDADLGRIAAAGRALDAPVLWCGTGGLAGALAGRPPPAVTTHRAPLLGLFGTNHPLTEAQLAAAAVHRMVLADGASEASRLARRLAETGVALVSFALPPGLDRAEAASRIGRAMAALAECLPVPATLVVAGGETLRAVARLVGAERLEVVGQVLPGIPCATLSGGRWDGVAVVSKSGAFGEPDLLLRLAAGAAVQHEEIPP